MNDFYNKIHYDGIWIDKNKPAQLQVLENTRRELLPDAYDYDVDKNQYEYIPYMHDFREKELTDLLTYSLSENYI